MPADVLVMKGRRQKGKGSTNRGDDNIITSGSVIAVADGQCMLIVEQGKIVEVCAETGHFVYDASTEPSVFSGNLGQAIKDTFAKIGERIAFGGQKANDQRVYYINTKEITGNKYGTPSPVPYRVVDQRAGIDMDISIRCFGEYSYRITNPLLFYTSVSGNISDTYTRGELEGQLKSEFLTHLQPAFARISEQGIRYSALPGHTAEMADAMNQVLSAKWKDLRGIEVVSVGVSSVKASEEDEATIKQMQKDAAYMDPTRGAAAVIGAQADAMRTAAGNAGGAAVGFMGMNMAAQSGGVNAQALYQMGAQQQAAQPQTAAPQSPQSGGPRESWTCPKCGKPAFGKFCPECGSPKPAASGGWKCPKCGADNTGKFCSECGSPKPADSCPKCGWRPESGSLPKFCPECGSALT